MNWLQPEAHVVVPSAAPLQILAERRQLERLLPARSWRLILVDCVLSFVSQSSAEFRSFLEPHYPRINAIRTDVHLHLQLLDKPVTENLMVAAVAEFLVHYLENAVGAGPAVMICDTRRGESNLAREQQFYPSQIKLMTLDGYLRFTELKG